LPLDLSPARWVWLPSERCLPNTFVLFRREIEVATPLKRATGWLMADSRYRLYFDGQRVQWGPTPSDPRQPEVDPVDLTAFLTPGRHVIGVEVCFFGHGDGTWVMGSPGLLMRLETEDQDGRVELVTTEDQTWLCRLDRAHRPGQYARGTLRSLQEDFDARLHPHGWSTVQHQLDELWLAPRVLPGDATTPPAFIGGPTVIRGADRAAFPTTDLPGYTPIEIELVPRSIPPTAEAVIPVSELVDAGRVDWKRPVNDWFESRVPDSFDIASAPVAEQIDNGWRLPAAEHGVGHYLTFRFAEQLIGFPRVCIDAPEGTVVELIVHESHDPEHGPRWLESHHHLWSRLKCKEGENTFEAFDYDSLCWAQVHVHGNDRPVMIREVAVRRRRYDWPNDPHVRCAEPELQALFDATVNTLHNACPDTAQDGPGRERQQYSGDCGHQHQALRYTFGELDLTTRYLKTYSQGMTKAGYFLDCWPGIDRLVRLAQREIGTTQWGPILDHGIGLNFDAWQHYLDSGRLRDLEPAYPRLLRFAVYLVGLRDDEGLLPVEGLGIPMVWIDHYAYRRQADKRCAFNLYAAAMYQHALAPICRAFGDAAEADRWSAHGEALETAAVATWWDADAGAFVINREHLEADGGPRFCDRSLANAVLFGQAPGGSTDTIERLLDEMPDSVGLSYPANAGWRLRALAALGRTDVVWRELRDRWANMGSVHSNKTLQEVWDAEPDTPAQFSHCPVAPLFVLMHDLLGVRAVEPGFARYEVRPQLTDAPPLDVIARTAVGPVRVTLEQAKAGRELTVTAAEGGTGRLIVDNQDRPLPPGQPTSVTLRERVASTD